MLQQASKNESESAYFLLYIRDNLSTKGIFSLARRLSEISSLHFRIVDRRRFCGRYVVGRCRSPRAEKDKKHHLSSAAKFGSPPAALKRSPSSFLPSFLWLISGILSAPPPPSWKYVSKANSSLYLPTTTAAARCSLGRTNSPALLHSFQFSPMVGITATILYYSLERASCHRIIG